MKIGTFAFFIQNEYFLNFFLQKSEIFRYVCLVALQIKRTIYKKPCLNESQLLTKCLVSLRLNSILFRQSLMLAGRITSRFGDLSRSARSPDLTLSDFYLWGTLKNGVHSTLPATTEIIKKGIRKEIAAMSHKELQSSMNCVLSRVRECLNHMKCVSTFCRILYFNRSGYREVA
ncbi:hypothetical protein ANN_22622 [Periplaneta americana]|uniref:Uncharacterized protein n=1 Tax=Periplaneta americana TaxID=6978 RepID=A0ABQ8S8P5_PERAM|nr:hypothetical protein ANN_22622 [Periplaneta americana]